MTNLFTELWKIAENMIKYINIAWDWLTNELIINIPLKIPLLIPDGLKWETGVTPISLLGVSLGVLIIYWVVWGR